MGGKAYLQEKNHFFQKSFTNLKKIKKSVFLHRFGLYFCHHSVTL